MKSPNKVTEMLSLILSETRMLVKENYKQKMLTFMQNSDGKKISHLTTEAIADCPLCYILRVK